MKLVLLLKEPKVAVYEDDAIVGETAPLVQLTEKEACSRLVPFTGTALTPLTSAECESLPSDGWVVVDKAYDADRKTYNVLYASSSGEKRLIRRSVTQHVLGVPPHMTSALEASNWIHGVTDADVGRLTAAASAGFTKEEAFMHACYEQWEKCSDDGELAQSIKQL
jgi:hypothetical protein